MEKTRKLELVNRSLGLRHKLKVHDSLPHDENHEEIALRNLAKWELEDELHAIEELLREARLKNVAEKKGLIAKGGPLKKKTKK